MIYVGVYQFNIVIIWVAVAVSADSRMAEPAARRVLGLIERPADKRSGLSKEQPGVPGHGSGECEGTSDW